MPVRVGKEHGSLLTERHGSRVGWGDETVIVKLKCLNHHPLSSLRQPLTFNRFLATFLHDMTASITILLADDHAVVRAGIRQFLESTTDLSVIAEADDGDTARRLIANTNLMWLS